MSASVPHDCFWEHHAIRGAYGWCETCGRVVVWKRCRPSREERQVPGLERHRAPKRYRCEEGHEDVRLERRYWPDGATRRAAEELRVATRTAVTPT